MVEERSAVHAGDDEPRVPQPLAGLAETPAPELGPRPERVVVLEEPELDPVIAETAGGVDHARERPGRAAERRKRELHVMRSSMAVVTRFAGRLPRTKRSRVSRTTSAIAP